MRPIFLVGLSGSGKTVIGAKLAEKIGVTFVDSDACIEQWSKATILEIFESRGENFFRRQESNFVDYIEEEGFDGVVATGGGLPSLPGMMERLNTTGITVYLFASVDVLWNRLTFSEQELNKRPLLIRDGRSGLHAMAEQRDPVYRNARHVINTNELDIDDIVTSLVEAIGP